jgi:hypothetical protein
MRFQDLQPQFLRREVRVETYRVHKTTNYLAEPGHVHAAECWQDETGPRVFLPFVERIEDAQGITFLCPKCFSENGGAARTHSVICWWRDRGVPDDAHPGPGRWTVSGAGFADLSLSPSVHLTGPGCGWHGFVTNGDAT